MYIELHPAIVHFPIALITLAYLFQVITVLKPDIIPKHLNLWILIPAALSTLPAVLSGENAEEKLGDICMEAQKTLENHILFANITTWSILLLTLIWIYITFKEHANHKVQRLLLAFLTLIFFSMCITGYLGGELVHKWNT